MYWGFLNIMAKKKNIIVKILEAIKGSGYPTPSFQTPGAACVDLVSIEDWRIPPHTTVTIKTSHLVQIPDGHVGLVCSRSGLASKHSVHVLNSPGVVDADYRGNVGVILRNSGGLDFTVRKGDRIAQLMILQLAPIEFQQVTQEEWDETAVTQRGDGGFGSTGK